MNRRRLLRLSTALGLGAAGAWTLPGCRRDTNAEPGAGRRLISIAPALTVTLFELGAGAELVAVSDYCDSPEAARRLPRVGTSLTPNYEAIAGLHPTLIIGELHVSARRRELEALAPTLLLPWLTLDEILTSLETLGTRLERAAPAHALAERLATRLRVAPPANGPRVLLLLGGSGGSDLWFVRDNSLHGAALRAAGARNAVAEAVVGPPRISYERLVELDPDAIVVLARKGGEPAEVAALRRFATLRAVREARVTALVAEEAFANDPRILALVDRLSAELRRLGASTGTTLSPSASSSTVARDAAP